MSESMRALLEQHHTFPGPYVFRVIGAAKGDSVDVQAGIEQTLGAQAISFTLTTQPSSAGRFVSYRVNAHLETVEQVLSLTSQLQQLPGVKFVV